MFRKVAIIGDGAMGTVLGMILTEKGTAVRWWGHDSHQLEQIKQAGENIFFLPGYKIPQSVEYQPDDNRIFEGIDLIVSAVPTQYIRGVWRRLQAHFPEGVPVVSVAKGIENDTLLRPSEVLKELLGENLNFAAVSGPTIADELARKLPATASSVSSDPKLAQDIQYTFSTEWFRIYTNDDVVGVELAAAMKNVIAIAAGIIDGCKAGDNAKAALLSRGLAEISRLGEKMSARKETFSGLAGLGDLVTTCISPKGRNRSFGERVGRGESVDDALKSTKSVVEGVYTCKSVTGLAERYHVEMPITRAVYEVIFENKSVSAAIHSLMTRELKSE